MTSEDGLRLVRTAEAEGSSLLGGHVADGHRPGGHRGVMRAVKTAVVLGLHTDSCRAGDPAVVRAASGWASQLEALQTPDGLFAGGDNLASPPDSAFTVNDAATTVRLLRRRGSGWPDDLRERLSRIMSAAAPALQAGGVHTPNHRWELAAALAQVGVLLPDGRLLERARVWLGEGIDVDEDGLYSERSPNYAAHVSNPSLTVLADLLERPDLHEVVHRNLHAHLDLTDRTGMVETVQSRRQDQHDPFPLGPFLGQFTRAAIRYSCARCAEGARRAADGPDVDAVDVLAQQLLDPVLAGPLPPTRSTGTPPQRSRRLFGQARLLRETRERTEFTIYGGSDVPAVGRIGSGLACNPTFLRMRLGAVAVESVRLSRDFFDLGPFRAAEMSVDGDHVVLRETVSASYYQPVPVGARTGDGRYDLQHEGRFAAAMSFSERAEDVVALTTTIRVRLHDDGLDLAVTTDGAASAHALEIALGPGGELTGAAPLGEGRFELVEGLARYARHGDVLRIGPGHGAGADRPPGYRPGEAYTFSGGTDAVGGTRLYLTWRSPGTVEVGLRRQ